MKVPKDAQLAIAIGFAAVFLFGGLGVYGIYYFFTGGCDENSEPYSAYEVREKIEAEYDFPLELEYLGETVTQEKPWKRVDYTFRDKERDFTFTAHASVKHMNATMPFVVIPGGRSYYTDYAARSLDRLNDEVQKRAKKRGLRFITPEEKAAHLGYQGNVDTVFLTDERELADAAELFLEIAQIYNVARFNGNDSWRDIAFCSLPSDETDLKKAQLVALLHLRGTQDIYEANDIPGYVVADSRNEAEPIALLLRSGWQSRAWRARQGLGSADGVGSGSGSEERGVPDA